MSQINNENENKDQISVPSAPYSTDDKFKTAPFFKSSTNTTSKRQLEGTVKPNKLAHLNDTLSSDDKLATTVFFKSATETPKRPLEDTVKPNKLARPNDTTTDVHTARAIITLRTPPSNTNRAIYEPSPAPVIAAAAVLKSAKLETRWASNIHKRNHSQHSYKGNAHRRRRIRSTSLPNIYFGNGDKPSTDFSSGNSLKVGPNYVDPSNSLLPPVNLQSLREIDLPEILKNPQLRHDIVFDPQLQFRPNLDGERGNRKKKMVDDYWDDIAAECEILKLKEFDASASKLPILFTTIRDILVSLLPTKDKSTIFEIMDPELLIQQLHQNSVNLVPLSNWLASVFKVYCAPMRDPWVDQMSSKFVEAVENNSIQQLVEGLRMVFSILEAMKLDVANHQIRLLRPVLVETAIEFEEDYYNQMISKNKINIADAIEWFKSKVEVSPSSLGNNKSTLQEVSTLKSITLEGLLDLLSCCKVVTEFPSTFAFDQARLVLLRADVRQVVCLQLCLNVYKQLLRIYQPSIAYRKKALSQATLESIKKDIIAIITDDNGNIKWTKNIQNIAVQLVSRVTNDPCNGRIFAYLPNELIDTATSWLSKQTQPSSKVYSLMEKMTLSKIKELAIEQMKSSNRFPKKPENIPTALYPLSEEVQSLSGKISILGKFHWDVFGGIYTAVI